MITCYYKRFVDLGEPNNSAKFWLKAKWPYSHTWNDTWIEISPPPLPPFFFIGTRNYKLYITVPLIYFQKILDSPLCLRGKIEDSKHYLLECPLYKRSRARYLLNPSKMCNFIINSEILLLRSPALESIWKQSIFQSVHNYIIQTKNLLYHKTWYSLYFYNYRLEIFTQPPSHTTITIVFDYMYINLSEIWVKGGVSPNHLAEITCICICILMFIT
jgi:hypothetical protein